MTEFSYRDRNAGGNLVDGVLEDDNPDGVALKLATRRASRTSTLVVIAVSKP